MDATGVASIAAIASFCAIGTFVFARMKDAEERGRLKQRVDEIENRQDKHDDKLDKVIEKIDTLSTDLKTYFDKHVESWHK